MYCTTTTKFDAKKNNDNNIDIAIRSFNGVKIYDEVCLFLLDKLKCVYTLNNIGLYRYDDLGLIEQTSGTRVERLKQNLTKIINNIGFKRTIDIGATTKILDISLNFLTNQYQVYSKPNSKKFLHK